MNRLIAFIGAVFLALGFPGLAYSDFQDSHRVPSKEEYATAQSALKPLAHAGNAAAQFSLGFIYRRGQGVAQSDTEAVKWYRKAADQGHARAQGYLGFMYDQGKGVPQSGRKALKWYTKAAKQGNANAQFNLGVMYAKGEGVPENYAEAYRWMSLAAASGDQDARKTLKIVKGWMTPGQIAEAQKLAAGGKVAAQATGWSAISRSDVKRLQKALNDLGFNAGPADGILGKRTKSALATFQRIKGLSVGAPDAATLSALSVE
jgi:TPR repeat protein